MLTEHLLGPRHCGRRGRSRHQDTRTLPHGGAPSVCSLCGSGVLDLTVAGNSQWSGRGSGCRPRRLPSCRAAPSKSSAASGFPVDRGGPTGCAHTRPSPAVWRCGTAVLAQRHGGRRAPRAVSEVSAPGPRTLLAGRCPPERPPGCGSRCRHAGCVPHAGAGLVGDSWGWGSSHGLGRVDVLAWPGSPHLRQQSRRIVCSLKGGVDSDEGRP